VYLLSGSCDGPFAVAGANGTGADDATGGTRAVAVRPSPETTASGPLAPTCVPSAPPSLSSRPTPRGTRRSGSNLRTRNWVTILPAAAIAKGSDDLAVVWFSTRFSV
jgi:hypothetical protein